MSPICILESKAGLFDVMGWIELRWKIGERILLEFGGGPEMEGKGKFY